MTAPRDEALARATEALVLADTSANDHRADGTPITHKCEFCAKEAVGFVRDHAGTILAALRNCDEHAEEAAELRATLAAVTADANAAIMALQRELETMRRERDERPVL